MDAVRIIGAVLWLALLAPRGAHPAHSAATIPKQGAATEQCPHFVPQQGAPCGVDPARACTFAEPVGLRICTCRPDRRWFCEVMAPPPHR